MITQVDGSAGRDCYSAAVRAFNQDNPVLAEECLERAFAIVGEGMPHLYLLSGRIAYAKGEIDHAEKAWKSALALEPNNGEAWNNLGVLLRQKGRHTEALNAFQRAQTLSPERPDIPYNIGNLHKAAGEDSEAISAYNAAISIAPAYAPAYNNLGTLYEKRQEREKALEVFRRGLANDSGNAPLRFNMGLVYQEQDQWTKAKQAFTAALKSRPGWVPGLTGLGLSLEKLGDDQRAARAFRALLEIEPNNVPALNNLGATYERLGRSEKARSCFQKALEQDPSDPRAALNLHDSYRKSNDLEAALNELNRQVTRHPENSDIHVRMGKTLMDMGRLAEAQRSLKHVLERNPHHDGALKTMAELTLLAGRPEQAERLLSRLPEDPEAVRRLARLYTDEGKEQDAQRLLEKLIASNPDDADSRRMLAETLGDQNPQRALELLQESMAINPGNVADLINTASYHEQLGQKERALQALDEAASFLGDQGKEEDLDSLQEVLSLYERTAAPDPSTEALFEERTAQLAQILRHAFGYANNDEEIPLLEEATDLPLEEDDALSLLDINAMEPVIRINEEESTLYLEDSPEVLEEFWESEPPPPEPTEPPQAPPYSPYPPAYPSSQQAPPSWPHPSLLAEALKNLPNNTPPPEQEVPQETHSQNHEDMELLLEEENTAPLECIDADELDEHLFPPEQTIENEDDSENIDVGAESQDETVLEELNEDDFLDENNDLEMEMGEPEDELEFLVPESDVLAEELPQNLQESPEESPALFFEETEEPESPPEESTSEGHQLADMFKYLSSLTEETVGEGRDKLIEEGVPLKLAGLHARLSGEPNLREVAQKFDRRKKPRASQVDLNRQRLKGTLDVFMAMAKALPEKTVSESLTKKLERLRGLVQPNPSEPQK
ncbi:MAG: tetratricopeptide repeat protein [Spirochaetales bacterium]|nr:tetratricopeptide repeat protein [Spirochaetales bacterium]